MYMIQLLLPLYDNDGQALPKALFAEVRDELVERFGGLTAYTQAPASGVWLEDDEHPVHDESVIYEVMAPALEHGWWADYRAALERRFRQEEMVVRAQEITLL
ncbi:hypothetical protein [Stutzerimonas azotifigens]|uniref:DUF1330 domain-containing protein n=1 Tax=Stutzerimonas azotifigens TaxID=291995 RepID=A0ABR5Z1L4_9GAMM|nr:hypothetical protein [Stutzerimonas azotifigens]MBA1274029.1 hypothetical protein [Stutzerimonas azotifigens]